MTQGRDEKFCKVLQKNPVLVQKMSTYIVLVRKNAGISGARLKKISDISRAFMKKFRHLTCLSEEIPTNLVLFRKSNDICSACLKKCQYI